ncbi:MAG: DUF4185 domain-containing protein [Tenericutes bacterium]|nr:DUF4185 domain-containing protein [Mycoplasmatota bacterium]
MKQGDLIRRVVFKEAITIELDKIYPIQPIDELKYSVQYFIGDEEQKLYMGSYYANRLIVKSATEIDLDIHLGIGYLSELASEWRELFVTDGIWQGGDGLFSFNIENGNDQFDQVSINKTLMVFGDTFVGRYDPLTQKRLQPHLMPNNSIAYLDEGKLEFRINKGLAGNVLAFYNMTEELDYKGPIARNLITYNQETRSVGYLSAYHPNSIDLVFDLNKERTITDIEFYNYYSQESDELAKRGFKDIKIFGSNDSNNWTLIKKASLEMASFIGFKQIVKIEKNYRYFKVECNATNGIGNHNDKSYHEGLFGLQSVKFFSDKRQFKDIDIKANTILHRERENAWIWLQDGVVINDNLYFLPLTVTEDQTQPEGLQFKVLGVSLFKTPIENGEINTDKTYQKMSPLYVVDNGSTYFYGAGIMPNTKQAGALKPDGYVYIYGYKTTLGLRELIVARVLAEDFENFDEWMYFDGSDYQYDILKSHPILGHISCEMSVSQILEGRNKGKYIACFTYDVNTKYLSIAIGDTPCGPFTEPQKIYRTLEHDIYKSTTYTYNAKAHPHLSNSKKILVSYNTNTYDFDHNMSHRLIYGPRFIYLNEIEE